MKHISIVAVAAATVFVATIAPAQAKIAEKEIHGTHIQGSIIGNVIWTASSSPYILDGDVEIGFDNSLTIEAGTEVLVPDGKSYTIESNGDLTARGGAGGPVRFENLNGLLARWGGGITLDAVDYESVQRGIVADHGRINIGEGVRIKAPVPIDSTESNINFTGSGFRSESRPR